MSKPKSNNAKTISVALTLCLVCSVLVSAVAVGLKPAQIENARLDRNKNILVAAGMYNAESDTASDVAERFKDFDVEIIDLNTGDYLDDDALKAAGIPDRNAYDASQATKNQALSEDLGDNDPAGIGRKPKYAKVYVKSDDAGNPEMVVLPIQGYGLWGTIYGFLTLESDMNTIKGISFYEHKETPGLGARIEEPEWRAQWSGIQSYDEDGNVAPGCSSLERHAWLKNVRVTSPVPSVISTSRSDPRLFRIGRSVADTTSATMLTDSPKGIPWSEVSSPREAYRRGKC